MPMTDGFLRFPPSIPAGWLPGGGIATLTTYIDVTGAIVAGTNFSVTSSGVNYTQSGDAGILLATSALFAAKEWVVIYLNGVLQIKNENATWVTATSFTLDVPVDTGDEIIIIS